VTDSFKDAHGRKVVSRTTAETLGELRHMVVDTSRRHVSAVVVSKGKKHAFLIDWEHVSGFGPDAVMVESEDTLRPPADDHEQAAADGKLELVGKRALSERGNEHGPIADVEFDPEGRSRPRPGSRGARNVDAEEAGRDRGGETGRRGRWD
jgi:uncharacterized protein YrrD